MTLTRRAALLLMCMGVGLTLPAASQAIAPQISLITVGPGTLVWEQFGHNMIRVTDPANGTDLAYNFGIFDFRQKNFYWNFLQGRMLYSVDGYDATATLEFYGRTGRSIEIQQLLLTPDQARLLADNLARNAAPDRKDYRYEPYRDNCSTRVRDALNVSLGGTLEPYLSGIPTRSTFRSKTAELTAGNPAVYFGLMLLLGPSTDRPLSAWEESFIPMDFARFLAPEINAGIQGGPLPLVSATRFVPAAAPMAAQPPTPASWNGWFLVLGVAIAGALTWVGTRSGAGRGHAAFIVLGGLWTLGSGFAGLIMVYLWAFTDHTAAYRNENVLQASVLGLLLFVWLAMWARRGGAAPRSIRTVALLVATLSLAGVVLQLLPWFSQVNAPALLFFVPANLGMALGAVRAIPVATAGPTEVLP